MAENPFLEGLTGGESESGDAETISAGVDPVASAVALDAAKYDPLLAKQVGEYLERQAKLVTIQTEHLHEQRDVILANLKLKRWGERFRVTLQALITAAVLAAVGAVLVMVIGAIQSNAVLVDEFKSPPALTARGLSGETVAQAVLDRLTDIQSATRVSRATRRTSAGWGGDIKIEVPETGVSLGEVAKILRETLGHDTHIAGDLVQQPDGRLTLTVRVEGVEAKGFTGPADQFDALAEQAAEYIYGAAEPVSFSAYLFQHGRYAEAAKVWRSLVSMATTPQARSQALEHLGVSLFFLHSAEAEPILRQAIKLDPENWNARSQLILMLKRGREEDAWRETQAFYVAAAHAPKSRRTRPWDFRSSLPLTQDWAAFEIAIEDSPTVVGGGGPANIKAAGILARGELELHDWDAGERTLALMSDDDPVAPVVRAELYGRRALEQGRIADAVKAMASLRPSNPVFDNFGDLACWPGLAYDLAGQPAQAQAIYAAEPTMTACRAFHADGLEHRGDHAGADAAYAQAIALAPDLPFAYHRQGLTLLERGDLDAAGAKFEAAHIRGPHWADPLKGEGDVLARKGQWAAAVARYDQALKFAPAWAELHQARDLALRQAAAHP
jgi:tetratricopeptide (TPR) repeat protein